MAYERRRFLKFALSGAVLISAGNPAKIFARDNFARPSKDALLLRVAVASDGHFGEPNTTYEAHHADMLGWISKEKSERGLDFTVINGDLYHNDITYLDAVKKTWDKLPTPYYVSHGNHDMVSEDQWKETWNNGWHYGFEKNDIAFIVLNTADDKGNYISADIEKTKQLLKQYERQKALFIFMHITPFKWTENGLDCPQIVELFNAQSNLKAVFHGHDHDQDNVKEHKGRLYLFDSHIAGSWGTAYRGYRILEVMKNGDILTYQVNPIDKKTVNSNKLV